MNNQRGGMLTLNLENDVNLRANWREFLSSAATAITDYYIKGPADGFSGGIAALLKLVTSVEVSSSNGRRLWILTASSFGWALDQISTDEQRSSEIFRVALRDALRQAARNLKDESLTVNVNYLESPSQLPIYQDILRSFCSKVTSDTDVSYDELSWRLTSLYNRGIFEIWSRKPDFYLPLAEAIGAAPSVAAEFEVNWRAYRAQLISDFEAKPLFGQEDTKTSLSKLYVPLRCTWTSEHVEIIHNNESDIIDDYQEQSNLKIGMLEDKLLQWIDQDDLSDWLRIIGGGPGSGKSTTLKSVARRIAERDDLRPLFIPLQYIDLKKDLRESINQYYTDTSGSAFTQSPLARVAVEDGPPLVLIFDGLDEITAPGEAARDVVGDFANRLATLLAALDGGGRRKVRVIVSGRMPAFQEARRYLTPRPERAFEVLGFLPPRKAKQEDSLWNLDQRPHWWARFAAVKKLSADLPPAYSSEKLEAITHEPLLCYLLALAGYATEQWEDAADNRNRIYSALVNSIYDRGWGDGIIKRQGAGKTLTRQDFNRLMETIALAAWLGGDARVASEQMFEHAVDITGSQEAWRRFREDNGDDVTNLAMNFYLKSSEKSERGFEFTHKSFGEYLAARAILSIAKECSDYYVRKPDHALQDWYKSTKSGKFDSDILQFCHDEARLWVAQSGGLERLQFVKGMFERIAAHVASDGFPISADGSSWRKFESEQTSAECGIWVILNACSRAIASSGERESALIVIDWRESEGWTSLFQRLGDKLNGKIIFQCMSNILAKNQEFNEFVARELNLDGAIIDDSLFVRVDVQNGAFSRCSMRNVRFYECKLSGVDFSDADMEGVIFHSSSLRSSAFDRCRADFIAFSPLSYLSLSPWQFENIGVDVRLLTTEEHSKREVADFVTDRIQAMGELDELVDENLIEDWSYAGPDFMTIQDIKGQ